MQVQTVRVSTGLRVDEGEPARDARPSIRRSGRTRSSSADAVRVTTSRVPLSLDQELGVDGALTAKSIVAALQLGFSAWPRSSQRSTRSCAASSRRSGSSSSRSAPLSGDGYVNVSPKGAADRCFRVLGPHSVAYLDLTGSGSETVAHLRENGRIVVMFSRSRDRRASCASTAAARRSSPAIRGSRPRSEPFLPLDELTELGRRAVIHVEVQRVSDSCGCVVPQFEYAGERDTMDRWLENRGRAGVEAYHAEANATSLDGLPSVAG